MNKKLVRCLSFVLLLALACTFSANAAESTDVQMRWINLVDLYAELQFSGTTGCFTAKIYGVPGVTQITATAKLSYKNTSGIWVDLPTAWSYTVYGDEMVIDETFGAIMGREYMVELTIVVYKDGYGETITQTVSKICS